MKQKGSMDVKGIVHPKKINSVINYSPSCHSKLVRASLNFKTEITIFLRYDQHHVHALFMCRGALDNGGRRDLKEKNC